MQFRIWCRWGELPLDSTDKEAAIEEAVSFALRNGKFVVLMDEDRNEHPAYPARAPDGYGRGVTVQ